MCVCVRACMRACLRACLRACVCVPIYLSMFGFYVRRKSEMKSVLNFCTGELCSEVVSFQRTEIQVWRLSSDYLPLEVFRSLTTEKQLCRPRTLPGIAYRFELKWGISLTYANENEEQI